MRSFLRKILAGTAVIAAFAGTSLAAAPAASASSGGGCAYQPTYASFATINACISAKNDTILPDGYVEWNSIPPGCRVFLALVDWGLNAITSYTYPCGWHHYGPLGWSPDNGYYYFSFLAVDTGQGNASSYSQAEYFSY